MLEQALVEVQLPAGIIDTEHIVPGSIMPENCKLDATWNFQGIVTASGNELSAASFNNPRATSQAREVPQNPTRPISSYSSSQSAPVTAEPLEGEQDVIFLNALKKKVIYTLPPVSKSVGRKVFIKRTDKDPNQICRVLTYNDDKVDDTDGVELGAHQAVILIASSEQWHVFSKLH